MNTMNNIPDQLFNLIESSAWKDLKESDKIFVLKHLSEEEYSNLHSVFIATQAAQKADVNMEVPQAIKQNLDKAFNLQHQKSVMVPLWQAAAVFLLMMGGFLFYTLNIKAVEKTLVNTIHDTLYVPQYVESKSKETDTVIVYKYIASKNSEKVRGLSGKPNEVKHENYLPITQIRTLSPEEIKSSIKNIKNKSMQEDTLYHKIGYASI